MAGAPLGVYGYCWAILAGMSLARRARKYVQPISGLRSRRSPDYTSEDILIQAAPLSAALARRVASPAAPVSSARETSSFTSSPTASSTCYTSSSIVSSILGRPTVAVGLEMRGAGDVGCWAGPSTWSWRCGELAINWRCVPITRATLLGKRKYALHCARARVSPSCRSQCIRFLVWFLTR